MMNQLTKCLCVWITAILVLVVGCWKSPATPVVPKSQATTEPTDLNNSLASNEIASDISQAEPSDADPTISKTKSDKEKGNEPIHVDSISVSNVPTFESLTNDAKQERSTWSRIALLLEGGPFLLDFTFSRDNQSLVSYRDRFLSKLANAFHSKDGKAPAWSTLLDDPRIAQGLFANLRPNSEDQRTQVITMYDINRDDVVDQDELVQFLTRGLTRRDPIALEEANRFRSKNRDESYVFKRLDSDDDGALSEQEILEAPSRLSLLDSNADGCITDFESQAVEVDPTGFQRQRRSTVDEMAHLVNVKSNKSQAFLNVLLGRYSLDEKIGLSEWTRRQNQFECFDSNRDQYLDRDEVNAWLASSPQVMIQITPSSFDISPREPKSPPPNQPTSEESEAETAKENKEENKEKNAAQATTLTVQLQELQTDREKVGAKASQPFSGTVSSRSPSTSILELPGLRLRIRLQDALQQQEIRNRIDQLASAMGVTENSGVKTSEASITIPGLNLSPEALDENQDGEIHWQEISHSMSVVAALTSAQVRIRWIDPPDAWFTWLDQNWDLMISELEWTQAAQRLLSLPKDHRNTIVPSSLPAQFEVLIIRQFKDESNRPIFNVDQIEGEVKSSSPKWFQAMDSNGDQVVSHREFVGGSPDFQRLDRNGDGFIESVELMPLTTNKSTN